MVDGKRETRIFKCKEDVWEVVDLIIIETKEVNFEEGKDFDISTSVISQIPFFACPNVLIDATVQLDIERYIYCEKFGVSPYNGSYGEQPHKWVRRSFAIRNAIAKKEKREIDARTRKNTNKV